MKRTGALLLLALASAPIAAADWRMDPAASRLEFVASYQGESAPGAFRQFTTNLRFDPRQPENGQLQVTVAVGSADMGSAELNEGMQTTEWFNAPQFPEAQFTSNTIRRTGDARFEAAGVLALKGATRKIVVPFTWESKGANEAVLAGAFEVDRTLFQIGTGDWATGDPIGLRVILNYRVTFRR